MLNASYDRKIQRARKQLRHVPRFKVSGRVVASSRNLVYAALPGAAVGDTVAIARRTLSPLPALVTGFENHTAALSPFGNLEEIAPGAAVEMLPQPIGNLSHNVSLGTIIDCFCRELPHAQESTQFPHYEQSTQREPICPLSRPPIDQQYLTGIRAVDALVPIGVGQRISVIAPPGVGKSTLLLMLAGAKTTTVNIFALIGERGREVRELIEQADALSIRSTSIFVVSTADEPAACRLRAAQTAMSLAEHYRSQGRDVMLSVDSLTRLARAWREIGLASGEPPTRKGFPPSVFAELPKLIERAGRTEQGSITAFYSLLKSESIDDDPIVEEVKSLTDGHLELSPKRAERGCYPAIDICRSISRVSRRLMSEQQLHAAQTVISAAARLESDRDLALLGSPDAELKRLLSHEHNIDLFLNQKAEEKSSHRETQQHLSQLASLLSGANAAA